MTRYYVIVGVSETIEVEASSEDEAVKIALGDFDASSHDPEVMDVWWIENGSEEL